MRAHQVKRKVESNLPQQNAEYEYEYDTSNNHDSSKVSFIYYVSTFLGFLDPPPPLRKHVFITENNQKLAFSDPPTPPTSDYVIYEWSHSKKDALIEFLFSCELFGGSHDHR